MDRRGLIVAILSSIQSPIDWETSHRDVLKELTQILLKLFSAFSLPFPLLNPRSFSLCPLMLNLWQRTWPRRNMGNHLRCRLYHLRCIIMVPLTPPETQTRSITLQMNSKWKIKEAERHRVSTQNSIKKKRAKKKAQKAGTAERNLPHLQPNFTLCPITLPMESDRQG